MNLQMFLRRIILSNKQFSSPAICLFDAYYSKQRLNTRIWQSKLLWQTRHKGFNGNYSTFAEQNIY